MVDQETIDRVAAAIESANIGHSLKLIRLVDGEATYRVTIDGRTVTFVDNNEADAIDQGYEFIRSVKQRKQAEAVISALSPSPETHNPASHAVEMDDEDRTPVPEGYDAAQWRKADEVCHAMALVADDTECVKIVYAALDTAAEATDA